jgi:hypothetical protein
VIKCSSPFSSKPFSSESEKIWQTTVFPSVKPSSRREVLLLDQWLNSMLQENLERNQDPLGSVDLLSFLTSFNRCSEGSTKFVFNLLS